MKLVRLSHSPIKLDHEVTCFICEDEWSEYAVHWELKNGISDSVPMCHLCFGNHYPEYEENLKKE